MRYIEKIFFFDIFTPNLEILPIRQNIERRVKNMKILLNEIMYRENLSVRQVSIMTGIPKSTISDIMNGKKMPRMDTMEQLAAGLKITISELYASQYK